MAPVTSSDHDVVEKQIKNAIQDIYEIMTQVHSYGTTAQPTRDILGVSVNNLDLDLQTIHKTAKDQAAHLPSVPPELVQYVDGGRNPDIYTREFVELARKENQLMKGKLQAFGQFRDVLAEQIGIYFGGGEMREDALRVVEGTGGSREDVESAVTRAEEERRGDAPPTPPQAF